MPRKPPLDVVRVVRERSVDEAAGALRKAADEKAEAKAIADRARREEQDERAAAEAKKAAESAALGASMSPRDLAQLAAFEHGASVRVERAAQRTAAAENREHASREEEDRKRDELVEARRSLDVVEKHQARWREAKVREDQAKIDEGAEESFAARRPRK